MRHSTLRRLLIASAVALALVGFVSQTLSTTGALQANVYSEAGAARLVSWLSALFFYLAPVVLALWAAHTLRPFGFMSDKGLSRLVSVAIVLLVAATVRSLFVSISDMAPYFPEFDNISLPTFVSFFETAVYSLVEIALLLFAKLQLKAKMQGHTLSDEMT